MSTPHPLEEANQQDASATGYWDPWEGPAPPHWYSGLLEAPFEGLGTGAAKGEAVLGGLVHLAGRLYGSVGKPRVVGQEIAPIGTSIEQDARERVRDMTPDPGTVGTAANVLHGVGEGAELFALGGAGVTGALAVGSGEGFGRYQELREHGVERAAAAEAGGLTAVTGTAGAMVPGGFGSTFLARLLTGAAANTTFGVANRYGDHLILEENGYHEMADQQRVLDGTQLVADAVLGATFGFLHHLGAPDERRQDAARTAALALQDRRAAPGVPVDPQAAGAHQAALETAMEQLMQGKPVDVADSGVEGATFARRPAPDTAEPLAMMADALKESGFLGEELSLHDLERQFEERQGAAPRAEEPLGAPPGRRPTEGEPPVNLEPSAAALAERPDLEVVGAEGTPIPAKDELARVDAEAEQSADAPKAVKAAVGCYARRGT